MTERDTRAPLEPQDEDIAQIGSLWDLVADEHNANLGTDRGREMLTQSLAELGAGRSVLVDKHGRLIAGNKTVGAAGALGMDRVKVVQTTGDEIIVVQRIDLDLDADQRARMLALADNRIAELDLQWDPQVLEAHLAEGLPLELLWTDAELDGIFELPVGGDPEEASEPLDTRRSHVMPEDDEDTPIAPPTPRSGPGEAKYPLAVVVDRMVYERWQRCKLALKLRLDGETFIHALDALETSLGITGPVTPEPGPSA
jgi:hypothetical protein